MASRFFRSVELAISADDFARLPRHSAYRYEYNDDRGRIGPRPVYRLCALDLADRPPMPEWPAVRPLPATELPSLTELFASAFARTEPFSTLGDGLDREAAIAGFSATLAGTDGPLVEAACRAASRESGGRIVGAAIVTLLPPDALRGAWCLRWADPPPPIAPESGLPHLTWVFVEPRATRSGVGTALLAAVAQALADLGFSRLLSTFLVGNTPSMLWHWRNRFQLDPE